MRKAARMRLSGWRMSGMLGASCFKSSMQSTNSNIKVTMSERGAPRRKSNGLETRDIESAGRTP